LNGTAGVRRSWKGPLPYATRPLGTTRPDPCNKVPSRMKRSCQRQTHGLDLPVRRTIAAVPQPPAVARTILARQTCFCGLFVNVV
jgi:hypothetical protein